MQTTIRVGCLQTVNTANQSIEQSLHSILPFIKQAANEGCKLLLLPELMTVEYLWSSVIWDFAETLDNSYTLRFLKEQCTKHSIAIGISMIEIHELHFYNTFLLVNSNAKLIAKIRKNFPFSFETFFFNGSNDRHVKHTLYLNIFHCTLFFIV